MLVWRANHNQENIMVETSIVFILSVSNSYFSNSSLFHDDPKIINDFNQQTKNMLPAQDREQRN